MRIFYRKYRFLKELLQEGGKTQQAFKKRIFVNSDLSSNNVNKRAKNAIFFEICVSKMRQNASPKQTLQNFFRWEILS